MFRSIPVLRLIPFALLCLVVACDGGGSGGGVAVASDPGTGSLAVVVTDGPIDAAQFSQILVTVTEIVLIGDSGQHTIFEDRRGRTIDLRELEDVSKLITLARGVPARSFEKIRLLVDEIELVPADGGPSIFPKLPPKIDLVPHAPIQVHRDKLRLLQIDIDAEKSIHIVETGNGKHIFRSVIFVEWIEGPVLGKLVLLEGTVQRLDLEHGDFLLCDTHPVSTPDGARRVTRYAGSDFDIDDPAQRRDFCIEIEIEAETSIFDEAGDPADLEALQNGELASVLGRFVLSDSEWLRFAALVIQQGRATAIDGVVLTDVMDDRFDMSIDAGQGFAPETLLSVRLQEGSRIFNRRGRELDETWIRPDTPARAVGVLAIGEDDFLKSSVVVLDLAGMYGVKVFGEIVETTTDASRIDLDTREGEDCANVPEDAEVFRVTSGMLEEIARSDLDVGDPVGVFGTPDGADGCIDAEKVIVFAEGLPR